MPKLGDRVLYRAHLEHHTIEERHATDEAGEKLFKTEQVKRPGDGALVERQVPVMEKIGEGSVHHPGLRSFVAIVGAIRTVDDKPVYDLLLLIPNRESKWVDGVAEGDDEQHHSFTLLGGDEVDHEGLHAYITALSDRVQKLEAALKA